MYLKFMCFVLVGATVAVECKDSSNNSSRPNFRQLVKTNEHGEFKVHLPFSVSKHVRKIKACSVKLISSSEPFCAVASTATSSLLRLKSRKEGTHIFSAGFFTFKPLKQPEVCDQKPSIKNTNKNLNAAGADSSISDPNNPAFLPPIRDPPSSSDLPSLPNLPDLPILPPLPVPEVPYIPPVPTKKPSKEELTKTSELTDKKTVQLQQRRPSGFFPFPLPPNPLLPPPSVLPPNPLLPPPSLIPPVLPTPPPSLFPPIFPSPPPSIFPPILPSPPSPPPSIFPPLIPFPGLNPPQPPPPRAPSFPIPIPFPPGFPGVPPASEPKKSRP